jgi:hypothetical protein
MLAFCRVLPPVRLATRRGLGRRYGVYLRILVESDSTMDFTLLHSRDRCQRKKKKEAAKGREVWVVRLSARENTEEMFFASFYWFGYDCNGGWECMAYIPFCRR